MNRTMTIATGALAIVDLSVKPSSADVRERPERDS